LRKPRCQNPAKTLILHHQSSNVTTEKQTQMLVIRGAGN
jgi:hypothetical protein